LPQAVFSTGDRFVSVWGIPTVELSAQGKVGEFRAQGEKLCLRRGRLAVSGGVGIEFRGGGEVGADRELVEIGTNDLQVVKVGDRITPQAVLPDGKVRVEAVGKAVLDELNSVLQGDSLRGKQQMEVVRHHDVRMEFVMAQGAVVEQGVEEEIGYASDLEDGATIARCDGDKGHAGPWSASGLPHIVRC
jgi:hypothetical protein